MSIDLFRRGATRRELAVLLLATVAAATPAFAAGLPLLGTPAGSRADGTPTTPEIPGGWRLVYFGYTHCPDVCPTSLQSMAEAIDALGALGERITPVFVTVDPDRDTVAEIGRYVAFFHPRMVGVVPSADDLRTMGKAWRVKFVKVEVPGHDYLMDHTAAVFLVDPAGEQVGRFSHDTGAAALADKIRAAVLERAP